jgi:acyl carrier protein
MSLISALEDEFEITIETDDIVDYSSYRKGIEILKKYKIEI